MDTREVQQLIDLWGAIGGIKVISDPDGPYVEIMDPNERLAQIWEIAKEIKP